MKFQSSERRKLMRDVREMRRAWLLHHLECWYCGGRSTCVNEMACGSHREKALSEPCCWSAACWDCNRDACQDYASWPLAVQLALKLKYDPQNFDRVKFNAIRGRAADAISWCEVVIAYCLEFDL